MIYGSVCSGIEAASVAWGPLGWKPAWFSEIDPFPSAVLAHRFPSVENRGDMTKYKEWDYGAVDILVGGTPCQSFSIAGLRKGLDDPRGNLMLVYLGIAEKYKPRWIVWENVPGVLSSHGGRDFGTFLGALGKLGYGFAYRVLDAQYFGVPQRRRRVFVVGHLGDWRHAAAVLFERDSLRRDNAPSRTAREEIARGVGKRAPEYYENHGQDSRITGPHETAETVAAKYGTGGNNTPIIMAHGQANAEIREDGQATTLTCNHEAPILSTASTVRRLTPKECERLQGFPDDWTLVPWRGKDAERCPDAPRYKACGNSMAVPVMRWIGERIKIIEGDME